MQVKMHDELCDEISDEDIEQAIDYHKHGNRDYLFDLPGQLELAAYDRLVMELMLHS